jgi:hypothetical protein
MERWYLVGTGVVFGKREKFFGWMVVMVARQCEYVECF